MRDAIIEEAKRKGYSQRFLCAETNRRLGLHVHQNTFSLAFKKTRYTKREELLRETARQIVKELPDIALRAENFKVKAQAAGFTLKEVWEYHSRTREKAYAYAGFAKAVQLSVNASAPFERRIAKEADECLEEMKEQRDAQNR